MVTINRLILNRQLNIGLLRGYTFFQKILPLFKILLDLESLSYIFKMWFRFFYHVQLDRGFFFFKSEFFFWPHPWHVEILGPEIKPMPQQWSSLHQWQWQILNLLSHQGTPGSSFTIKLINLANIFLIFSSFGCTHAVWKFLGQGSIQATAVTYATAAATLDP